MHAFRTRDITLRVPSKDKLLRFSFCSARHLLAETIRRHDLLRSTRAHVGFLQLLGTQITFANLLASALEGEERVEARFTAEEATILTEALALGECRCYLRPEYNAQLAECGLPTFPLRVNRILYRQEKPFSSVVHADLAELLQPPCGVASNSAAAATGANEASDAPFSLYLPGTERRVPLEAWKSFFSYNSSLHAYNYLRRSDGSVPAVWLQSRVDATRLMDHGFLNADGTAAAAAWQRGEACSDEDEEKKAQDIRRALLHAIPFSFGVVVTPLAAGVAVDQRVNQLNRVVMESAALLSASPGGGATVTSALQPLLDRCAEKHTACQHILSLVSGDHDGAYQAAVAARQYNDDPAQVAAVVDPIRRALGVQDFVVPLAAAEAARTGLDFFCRCSKQNVLESLVSAPPRALESLKGSGNTVHCSFCGRRYKLAGAEWQELEMARSASTPPQRSQSLTE
ncbi:Hsp33 protein [Leishmania donovani]|uniref:Hsp33 family protein n=1 Tax=Leishmania donovani TaxID=5661 RepID=A0A504X8C6_LEIDO|nr:Hsp33 family protein [Leishmania donovani]CAJ1990958.1 Hsp33 protein [Leishmania donovani]VDZ46807.1 Hsp33_protein_putative/Pfam:PF01430 [Leishmania donovani]